MCSCCIKTQCKCMPGCIQYDSKLRMTVLSLWGVQHLGSESSLGSSHGKVVFVVIEFLSNSCWCLRCSRDSLLWPVVWDGSVQGDAVAKLGVVAVLLVLSLCLPAVLPQRGCRSSLSQATWSLHQTHGFSQTYSRHRQARKSKKSITITNTHIKIWINTLLENTKSINDGATLSSTGEAMLCI